jgi:hypothetical protein
VAHQNANGPAQELWQSLRVWLWLAPNNVRAICKVVFAESRLLSWLSSLVGKGEVRSRPLAPAAAAARRRRRR